jgi:hypothetical protein
MSLGVIESRESVCEERVGVCAGVRDTAQRLLNPGATNNTIAQATRAKAIDLERQRSDLSWREQCARDNHGADVPASHSQATQELRSHEVNFLPAGEDDQDGTTFKSRKSQKLPPYEEYRG